jgi:hypothetical protein
MLIFTGLLIILYHGYKFFKIKGFLKWFFYSVLI